MPCSLVDHFTHSRTCRQMKMKAAVWNVSTKSKEPQVRGPHGLDAIFGHSNWRIAGAAQLSCTTILDIRISNRCVSKIYLPSNNGYGKCPPSSSTWRKPRTPTKSLPSLRLVFLLPPEAEEPLAELAGSPGRGLAREVQAVSLRVSGGRDSNRSTTKEKLQDVNSSSVIQVTSLLNRSSWMIQ